MTSTWTWFLIFFCICHLGVLTVRLAAESTQNQYFEYNFPTDAKAYITLDTNVKQEQSLVKPASGLPADIVFSHTYSEPGCRNVTLSVSNYISSIRETKEVSKLLDTCTRVPHQLHFFHFQLFVVNRSLERENVSIFEILRPSCSSIGRTMSLDWQFFMLKIVLNKIFWYSRIVDFQDPGSIRMRPSTAKAYFNAWEHVSRRHLYL